MRPRRAASLAGATRKAQQFRSERHRRGSPGIGIVINFRLGRTRRRRAKGQAAAAKFAWPFGFEPGRPSRLVGWSATSQLEKRLDDELNSVLSQLFGRRHYQSERLLLFPSLDPHSVFFELQIDDASHAVPKFHDEQPG